MMSFSLSFSESFFFAEGEPYDTFSDLDRPVSVWAAIEDMRLRDPEKWDELAREVFGCRGRHLTSETVLDLVRETDTCTDLSSPVEVWIDSDGDFRLDVHDEEG